MLTWKITSIINDVQFHRFVPMWRVHESETATTTQRWAEQNVSKSVQSSSRVVWDWLDLWNKKLYEVWWIDCTVKLQISHVKWPVDGLIYRSRLTTELTSTLIPFSFLFSSIDSRQDEEKSQRPICNYDVNAKRLSSPNTYNIINHFFRKKNSNDSVRRSDYDEEMSTNNENGQRGEK